MLSHAELREHIVQFSFKLRREGVKTSQADTLVAIHALEHIDLLDKQVFYYTLRAIFCFSPEDYRRFERVFRGYWEYEPTPAGEERLLNESEAAQDDEEENESSISEQAEQGKGIELNQLQPMVGMQENHDHKHHASLSKIGSYSRDEQLLIKRFMADPLFKKDRRNPELALLLYLLKKSLAKDKDTSGTKAIHFRKTIRQSIQFGGEEIFKLYKHGRAPKIDRC